MSSTNPSQTKCGKPEIQVPSEGRVVFYYPGDSDGDIQCAVNKNYAAATITGVIDQEAGYVNLSVHSDGVGTKVRTHISHVNCPVQGSREGVYWDWPPRK